RLDALLVLLLLLLQGQDGEELKDDIGGQVGGDLAVVKGGQDLHDVEAHKVHGGQGADQFQRLQGGEAAHLGGAGAGGVGGVHKVDVEGQEAGLVTHPLLDGFNQGVQAHLADLVGGNQLHPQVGGHLVLVGVVE